ncbi:septation protein A [Inhella gelatinilytica]|uniref:Inner membrane-spanning protein YciB n=1 Tax=Inhella gelatinilytica TaxID=2795030 RepID=A0A931IUR3_9BURK|nr:septation protein A [Inhella gelatinilytica]MBH9552519.1 septation protein A [Inhella gelatinilytica]
MKLLLDFFPLALFFVVFKTAEAHREQAALWASQALGWIVVGGQVGATEAPVLLATVAVVLGTLIQVLVLKLRREKIDTMLWISLALVLVLGALTVYFRSETFIKWKPTGLYWAMALGFWISVTFFRLHPLRAMLKDLTLPDAVWNRLLWAWIGFFSAMGALNLVVAYQFDTSTWANFKVFGATGLFLIFTLAQGLYLSRHLPDTPSDPQS